MSRDLIRANLNLFAVLQNLEELPRLDPEMGTFIKDWNISIQFTVWNGPAAHVAFANGACAHGRGSHPAPTVRLFFISPRHLNRMFDGSGSPIPLKGFSKLSFLQKDFTQMTERLEHYLKPEEGRQEDEAYLRANATMMLYTAAHGVSELAGLDPICRAIAAHTPRGTLQMGVQNGPCVHIRFDENGVSAGKGPAKAPDAMMMFRDFAAASALLNSRIDAFTAVVEGGLILQGMLPIVDNVGLIMDRIPRYLG